MAATSTDGTDVLVVGAGPTGLMAAAELARHGVRCRIIDKAAGPSSTSKAIGVHARTLEIFEHLGIAEAAIARGVKAHGVSQFSGGKRLIHLAFDELESPFPFILCLEQSETERVLGEHLARLGLNVERRTELTSLAADADGVTAVLRKADGSVETLRVGWVVGCDGAHSTVRHAMEIPFEGAAYEEAFLLADVHIDWDLPDDELYVFIHSEGLLAAFPIRGGHRFRLIAEVRSPEGESAEAAPHGPVANGSQAPTLEEIQAALTQRGPKGATVRDPVWLARFRIHHRIAPEYRKGRVFLAGDAAHIHSPVGGQGMNFGLQDAFNLGWKLALVIRGAADPALLDSYNAERHAVGQDLLKATDAATRALTLRHPVAVSLRNTAMGILGNLEVVQQRMRRTISEVALGYRGSPAVAEHRTGLLSAVLPHSAERPGLMAWHDFGAGPAAGDRAPDAHLTALPPGKPTRLFTEMSGTAHHLLLFAGAAPVPAVLRTMESIGEAVRSRYGALITVHMVVPGASAPADLKWSGSILADLAGEAHHRYGARSECLYLVRPDGYVGYRSQPALADELDKYLARWFTKR